MTETHTREWKRLWKDDYLKWICGFANAAGGVLEPETYRPGALPVYP